MSGRAADAVTAGAGATHAIGADAGPLLTACSLVCTASGIDLGSRLGPQPPPSSVADIAAAARLRTRSVALRTGWWRRGADPLVGFAGGLPVALLPGRLGRYRLVDPTEGTRTSVTAGRAAGIAPIAHVFYRPFPDRPLRTREVLSFAAVRGGGDIAALLTAGAAGSVLALVAPVAAVTLFSSLVPAHDRLALVGLMLALVAVAVSLALLQVARALALQRLQTRAGASIQAALWDRLLRLPPQFFRAYMAGDLTKRALGIDAVRQLLTTSTVDLFTAAGFSLVSFILLFLYDPTMGVVAAAAVGCVLGAQVLAARQQLPNQRSSRASELQVAGLLAQIFSAIGKLRIAGAEDRAFARWAEAFAGQRRAIRRAARTANRLATFAAAAPLLTELGIFAAASARAPHGLTTATFVGFNAALLQVLVALVALGPALASLVAAAPAVEAVRPIIRAVPETRRGRSDPGELRGEIELSHASFRYPGDSAVALDDVSLHVSPGELVALVGPSGAGKSTLIRLLLGFDQPQAGSVLFDRQNLRDLDLERVRQQIGTVLQNGGLLPADIFTNIVGPSGGTLDDAWQAARLAGLDEQIQGFPMGMHTVVAEQASTFSGGERQKLMLARAVVGRPRIILLDEATSAIDASAEQEIAERLTGIAASRIVVAHRVSTIMNADRIYLMIAGRIASSGTYSELLERSGTFADLVHRQLL